MNNGLSLKFEKALWNRGFTCIAGVDEVGRGSFAGPVVAAAVVFNIGHKRIMGIDDSKRLSSIKRKELDKLIRNEGNIGIGQASVKYINSYGILNATLRAMKQAINKLINTDYLLVDGNRLADIPIEGEAIIRGDQQCYSIAAASIVAKVYRDQLMEKLHKKYPLYDWYHNKGYGTEFHREALLKEGITEQHRLGFLRKVF